MNEKIYPRSALKQFTLDFEALHRNCMVEDFATFSDSYPRIMKTWDFWKPIVKNRKYLRMMKLINVEQHTPEHPEICQEHDSESDDLSIMELIAELNADVFQQNDQEYQEKRQMQKNAHPDAFEVLEKRHAEANSESQCTK